MLLGTRLITSGDFRRYEVDYADFLQHGDTISTTSVTQNGATSSIGPVSTDVTNTKVFFFLSGGVVNETPTVTIKITTVMGEIVNDTIAYQVVAA